MGVRQSSPEARISEVRLEQCHVECATKPEFPIPKLVVRKQRRLRYRKNVRQSCKGHTQLLRSFPTSLSLQSAGKLHFAVSKPPQQLIITYVPNKAPTAALPFGCRGWVKQMLSQLPFSQHIEYLAEVCLCKDIFTLRKHFGSWSVVS
jgi:hypothetical protein